MIQYSKLDGRIDARYHFSSGASAKILISKSVIIQLVCFALLSVITVSCSKNDVFENSNEEEHASISENVNGAIRNGILVDKIYDYKDNLLVEYIYDTNNKLIKRIYTQLLDHPVQTVDIRSEDTFEYLNGRVSKVVSNEKHYYTYPQHGYSYPMNFHSETVYEYDSQGKLIKTNGKDLNYRYENGRIVSVGTIEEPYTNTIIYDESGNVKEHIYIRPELTGFGQPIPGTTRRAVYQYEYDDKPKPCVGVDYMFYNPIPWMGDDIGYAVGFSKNNLTKNVWNGTTWTYTYNEHGLPETIEMKWKDIETLEPMLMRITYKQIK
jgi:hypothetical protein